MSNETSSVIVSSSDDSTPQCNEGSSGARISFNLAPSIDRSLSTHAVEHARDGCDVSVANATKSTPAGGGNDLASLLSSDGICQTMAYILSGPLITMPSLKQVLQICRLVLVPVGPLGLPVLGGEFAAAVAPMPAIVAIARGLCSCLRAHASFSPPLSDESSARTIAEFYRMVTTYGEKMEHKIAPTNSCAQPSQPVPIESQTKPISNASVAVADQEAVDNAHEEDSDWDDWDEDDDEEEPLETGPRYADVGEFLWWLVLQPKGSSCMEGVLSAVDCSESVLLLAAMRHSTKSMAVV